MDKVDKIKFISLITFRLLLVATGSVAIYNQNWTNLILSILTMLVTFLPSIIERRFKVDYPSEGEIVILLFIIATMYLGEMQDFYLIFPWWDLMLHFMASFIFAGIGFSLVYLLNEKRRIKLRPGFVSIFAFSFILAMEAVWEIIEFTIDQTLGANMQKSGLVDTMGDLIITTFAALIISITAYLYTKGKIRKLTFYERLKKNFIKHNPKIFTP